MKYYIKEKKTGLIDGYYEDDLICKLKFSLLNKLSGNNNKFDIKKSTNNINKDIREIKTLNNFNWFVDDKNVSH